ncbi:hypothetical protein [Brevibacterium otitidis]|uniref:Uncharacterized protein n=1 Tax=Brevibacterium otitidis TaxID=53364 RepID=A0ABV5X2J0_9MICO|nr:hypothetical protein GCM10023233_03170 [Brevibacterium otitidis]
MTVHPVSPVPAAASTEAEHIAQVPTHEEIRTASLRTASGPATLFWTALLVGNITALGAFADQAPSQHILFFAIAVMALPALFLVLRARSGFPILGLRDGSRKSVLRARLLGLIGPGLLAVWGFPFPAEGIPGAIVAVNTIGSVLILISMLWLQLRITDTVKASPEPKSCGALN